MTERVGFGSIAAVQVSYLALRLTLDLFPSENLCPKYRRQADNSCALNSKYRATCRPKWPAWHYDSKLPKPHENPARLSFRLFDGLARIFWTRRTPSQPLPGHYRYAEGRGTVMTR